MKKIVPICVVMILSIVNLRADQKCLPAGQYFNTLPVIQYAAAGRSVDIVKFHDFIREHIIKMVYMVNPSMKISSEMRDAIENVMIALDDLIKLACEIAPQLQSADNHEAKLAVKQQYNQELCDKAVGLSKSFAAVAEFIEFNEGIKPSDCAEFKSEFGLMLSALIWHSIGVASQC